MTKGSLREVAKLYDARRKQEGSSMTKYATRASGSNSVAE